MHPLQGASFLSTPLQAGILKPPALRVVGDFDVAGHITGAGSPDWQRSHRPAHTTAAAITSLVEAGARLVGKTQMDELAYGALGENAHYGTPRNPAAPDRVP